MELFQRLKEGLIVFQTPLHTFTNNNRYTRIEIDFPPMLDANFEMNLKAKCHTRSEFWDTIRDKSILK